MKLANTTLAFNDDDTWRKLLEGNVGCLNLQTNGCWEIWNFSPRARVQVHISPVRAANEWGNELTSRREIPCLRTPMYYYIFAWNLQFFGRKHLNNNGLLHEKLFETELIALRRFSKFNLRWKCYHNFLILDIRIHSTNISFCLLRFLTLPSRLLPPSFFSLPLSSLRAAT